MRTTARYSTIPTRAMVSSVANMSGMSNSEPRARLMSTPRPRPLADEGPDDGERHPDAHATEDAGQRRGDLERGQHLTAGRPERATELEQAGID